MDVDEALLNYIRLRIQDIASKPPSERSNYWISLIQEIAFTSISIITRNQAANEVRLISNAIKDINNLAPELNLLIKYPYLNNQKSR